jgi:dTDP-4-amino-4,6-dideoxygalactose transaminase
VPDSTTQQRDAAKTSGIQVPFNRPHVTGREERYLAEALENGQLAGNGPFSRRCADWLAEAIGSDRVLLTHSATGALEMCGLLAGVERGDEVVMPSFGYVTSANVFAIRGAVPVFMNVREDTLSIDESELEQAITPRTRAIMAVHYAGGSCDMDAVLDIAAAHDLIVIEDAAQAIMASYNDRPLGGLGQLGAISFHDTKNVTSGEGGALLVNDPELVERAEIVHEKGTNRLEFVRGEVDKYTWVDLGSSYLMSDLAAAFLWAQLEDADRITARRVAIWDRYHEGLEELEREGRARRPRFLPGSKPNGHIYYLLAENEGRRNEVLERLRADGIQATFHYVPLHSSPGGQRYGRVSGDLSKTDRIAGSLVRLPLWADMTDEDVEKVIAAARRAFA